MLKLQSVQKSTSLPGLESPVRSSEDFAKEMSRRKFEDACDAKRTKTLVKLLCYKHLTRKIKPSYKTLGIYIYTYIHICPCMYMFTSFLPSVRQGSKKHPEHFFKESWVLCLFVCFLINKTRRKPLLLPQELGGTESSLYKWQVLCIMSIAHFTPPHKFVP